MATPIGTTTNYGLNKWADGANPGGSALNATLDAIDTQMKVNADAASETTLTKIIYSVTGVEGNADLNGRELFNNTGLTLTSPITPKNGVGDFQFIYDASIGTGKTLLFTPQTLYLRSGTGTDTAVIKGYVFMDNLIGDLNNFIIRTVDADFEDAGIITPDDHLIWEFIIVDA